MASLFQNHPFSLSGRYIKYMGLRLWYFATFNNISDILRQLEYPEKTTDLTQVIDKLSQCFTEYTSPEQDSNSQRTIYIKKGIKQIVILPD
jgi:hypothetical protein